VVSDEMCKHINKGREQNLYAVYLLLWPRITSYVIIWRGMAVTQTAWFIWADCSTDC